MSTIATGSDSFILTTSSTDKAIPVPNTSGKEYKLTITMNWQEYRQVNQPAGSLWFEFTIGKQTSALPSIGTTMQIQQTTTSMTVVTLGAVDIHYTGQASAHVWVSWFAEYPS